MRANLNELKEGCILSTDVFSRTNRPIMSKKTVLTHIHINVLKAFLVEEVEVEKFTVDGTPFDQNESYSDETEMEFSSHLGFFNLFLTSVNKFKKEFVSWQSGLPVDIGKIRSLLLPLLEKMDSSTKDIFNLHRYSTKENYLFQHSVAVGLISGFLGKKMNFEKGEWLQVALAGCLADCGMAKIDPSILLKTSPLTIQEYREVKKHPIFSYKMVENISLLRKEAKIAILEHHERIDGTGYPMGKKEERIPLYAKIIALADIFHAMTSERLYRSKQSPYKALEIILEDNFGKFDINLVKILTSSIIHFSTGDKIRLSDGRTAEVLFVDEKSPTRPLLKIIDTKEVIQLAKYRNIFIDDIVS